MRPDQLKRTLEAKQGAGVPLTPNAIDIYGDKEKHGKQLMLQFHRATSNFMLNENQVKEHIDGLLRAARAVGIDYTGSITWK